jgi:hypothetical protein
MVGWAIHDVSNGPWVRLCWRDHGIRLGWQGLAAAVAPAGLAPRSGSPMIAVTLVKMLHQSYRDHGTSQHTGHRPACRTLTVTGTNTGPGTCIKTTGAPTTTTTTATSSPHDHSSQQKSHTHGPFTTLSMLRCRSSALSPWLPVPVMDDIVQWAPAHTGR